MRNFDVFGKKIDSDWISISDLMAGLMMIFLFIAISFMNSLQIRANQVKKIAVAYQILQENLYQDLYDEFKNDLSRWNAELEKDLTIRFNEPDVLFSQGSAEVQPVFQEILKDFFPRYLNIMFSKTEYKNNIEEIRIEGHTSSEWSRDVQNEEAYFLNMDLSQDRTRTVLQYCLGLILEEEIKNWARKFITANGLSSSRIITDPKTGNELISESRRVEFRTKTAAEKKVVEIIREMESDK